MRDLIYLVAVISIGALAFLIGRKFSKNKSITKTSILLINSIRAIAELAVWEFLTDGIIEKKEKATHLVHVIWKNGLLSYSAKIKVGFDIQHMEHNFDHSQKIIRIMLPELKVLSCEIYDKKFYNLQLEKAENVPLKWDIIQELSNDERTSLEEEARENAIKKTNEFCSSSSLGYRIKPAWENVLSSFCPGYRIEILFANEQKHKLPGNLDIENKEKE